MSILRQIGIAVGLVLFAVTPASARNKKPTIGAGLWEITWIESRLAPAAQAHEIVSTRCYTGADVARSSNPVMPAAQERQCRSTASMIGSDLVYDTTCGTTDHRLRMEECDTGYCGVYRYSPRKESTILESIVLLRRLSATCSP